jgi:peptidoglycan/xylan/chitin deacetylase (PgdA/CDA1 family)
MANPIAVSVQGKGFLSTLQRGGTVIDRYGLTAANMERDLQGLVDTILAFSCAATLPVTAVCLARHPNMARKLQAQGMELAVHGLRHRDHTLLILERLVSELQQALHIFSTAGIAAVGFRSPYLRWNADTLAALKACGFSYDSSQALAWDVTGSQRTPGYQRALEFYCAQQATKYLSLPRLKDDLVHIPYCLPDDEAMVERLHLQDDKALAEIWLALLDWVYASGELFTLGLHPERSLMCRKALWAVLEKAHSLLPGVWIARLGEIAQWQQVLSQAKVQACEDNVDTWQISVQTPAEVVLLAREVYIYGQAQAWAGRYQKVLDREVTVHCHRRPWIGLAPDCPAALHDFLKQQGYLTETSDDVDKYPFYLQLDHFTPEDERPLLAEIEAGDWPLVRIARWPGGAKAALAITGDVDAFTLWDYAHRMING